VIAAGWDSPHLFVEPGVSRGDYVGPWTQRPETASKQLFQSLGPQGRFGALQNYVQSLNDILLLEPDAGMFLYFQDDILAPPGLMDALNAMSWPGISLLSMWCPSVRDYQQVGSDSSNPAGLAQTPNASIMGAQAYVMPRATVEHLAACSIMREWQGRPRSASRKKRKAQGPHRRTFDYATGESLHLAGCDYRYFTHSLVHHFEPDKQNSSIGNAGASVGAFRSHNFVGTDATCDDIKEHFGHRETHVVILGYNLPHLTVSCIEAVKASTVETNICYVDNGSGPEALKQVRAALQGTQHEIIVNPRNMKYTHAAQQGIDRSDGRHVLMLNNDCRVMPDTIERLLHAIGPPKTASACPTSNDESTCSRNNKHNRGTGIHERKQLPWFCCLLHRDAVAILSQFPADEGMESGQGLDYWWCEKLIAAGWRHVIDLDAYAEHDHHATFNMTGEDDLAHAQDRYRKWRREQVIA